MKKNTTKLLIIPASLVVLLIGGVTAGYYLIEKYQIERALNLNKAERSICTTRGGILDADGNILAITDSTFVLHYDCTVEQDSVQWRQKLLASAEGLAELCSQRDSAQWVDRIQEGRRRGNKYLTIGKNLTGEDIVRLKMLPLFREKPPKGGRVIEVVERRRYPFGALARSSIGFISNGDTANYGLEYHYDKVLKGTKGIKELCRARYEGKNINRQKILLAPDPGRTVRTTLSLDVQSISDSILRTAMIDYKEVESACVIIMQAKTGAIRAMVNLSKDGESGDICECRNVAVEQSFEPGSHAQTFTLAAALADGFIKSLDDKFPTNHGHLYGHMYDYHIQDYERQYSTNEVSVLWGYINSSRYVPCYLAGCYYGGQPDRLNKRLQSYCQNYDFDLGVLPRANIRTTEDASWDETALLTQATGYGYQMAPLSILAFYNAIANKGMLMKPYLVEELITADKSRRCGPESIGQIMPSAVADTLTRALKSVTEEGTGRRLRGCVPAVAGKTGTSLVLLEAGDGINAYRDKDGRAKWASSFVGFYPADAPEYSIMCVLFTGLTKQPMQGGGAAALIVKDIITSNYIDNK